MSEPTVPNWDAARRLVSQFMTDAGMSDRGFARAAGIQPSIISRFLTAKTKALDFDTTVKLYAVMRPTLSPISRRDFLKLSGLGAFIELVGFDVLLDLDPAPGKAAEGRRLLDFGNTLQSQGKWTEAISFYRRAEQFFGPASSQA